MAKKRIIVTQETDTGRNQTFEDTKTGDEMSRAELVKKIEQGKYPDYTYS